ncbi:unnamed protein product [Vicia faba]|uniref:Uncharacterized protein n=1 Tax=Vicia faba TaxID=3906 RepID=A0AAV0ZVV6_VICFA|nr:unnamed protein product [Vicia faba]
MYLGYLREAKEQIKLSRFSFSIHCYTEIGIKVSIVVCSVRKKIENTEDSIMTGEGHNMLTIPKFDENYEHWSMLIENLLRSKEWWNLTKIGYVEPARGKILNGAQRQTLVDLKLTDLKVKKLSIPSYR